MGQEAETALSCQILSVCVELQYREAKSKRETHRQVLRHVLVWVSTVLLIVSVHPVSVLRLLLTTTKQIIANTTSKQHDMNTGALYQNCSVLSTFVYSSHKWSVLESWLLVFVLVFFIFRFVSCAFCVFMAALCNSGAIIFLPCDFYLSSIFFSSPNLSGHRSDVYHTSTHGVALVRI